MTEIIPFPCARRRDFVLRQATRVASLSPIAGEKHLARQLKVQADTMARKGVAPERIKRECAALECAIRSALWRIVLTPGGAA